MPASITPVPASSSPVILIPSAVNRMSAGVFNDSDKVLYLKYGMDASVDSYTMKIWPQQFFSIFPKYGGVITGFWEEGATGRAMVSELYTRDRPL